jgi:CheY-like chemotaxis protein
MSKSILVLEENSVVHGLVASALDIDGLTLHHEFNPAKYLERARSLQPDLILFSNADQGNNYAILRQLKTQAGTSNVPLVLLANSRDRVDPAQLRQLRVSGLVRKPFEASDLQQQVSKHLDLVDLVGSAYEYNKSQSAREEGVNPLARLDILDPEIPALLQDSGGAGPAPGAVPEVDFSAELGTERPRQAAPAFGGDTRPAQGSPTAPRPSPDALDVLDDGPVERFTLGTPDTLLGEDVLLDEGDLVPPLGDLPPLEGMASFGEGTLEELGPQDLLDEEAYVDATFAPVGVDQTLQRPSSTPAPGPARLDDIEVELSIDELSLPEEPEAPRRTAAPPRPEATAPRAPELPPQAAKPAADRNLQAPPPLPEFQDLGGPAEPGSDLPPAVRRMMELKPVFSKAPEAADLDQEPFGASVHTTPHDTQADLGLGDDELDEAAILRAMEDEEGGPLPLLDSNDADLLALSASEESELDGMDLESDLGPLPGSDAMMLDRDEEDLILSSLQQEEPVAEAEAKPRQQGGLELTPEERAGLTQAIDAEQEEVLAADTVSGRVSPPTQPQDLELATAETIVQADLDEMDLLDDLSLDTGSPAPAGKPSEVEEFVNATFQNIKVPEMSDEEGWLRMPPEEMLEVPVPEPEPETEPATEARALSDAQTRLAVQAEVGLDFGTDLETSLMEETLPDRFVAEEQAPAGGESASESSGVSDSFEDAFAALKEEIEANPEGERLDDVLKLEQLQDEVAKIEFHIPQHENALARGIPIYSVPESIAAQLTGELPRPSGLPGPQMEEDSVESMRRLEGHLPSAAAPHRVESSLRFSTEKREADLGEASMRGLGQAVTLPVGSLLDEATKARLSQVLDEIISVSVRKAVREEMPRLLERMAQEQDSAPRT